MNGKRWVCPELGCGRVLRSKHSLGYHVATVHARERPRDFKCEECRAAFLTEKTLTTHIRVVHTHVKIYKCKFCRRQFKTKSGLEGHAASRHGHKTKLHKCDYCPKTFLWPSSKYSHHKSHQVHVRQKCASCHLTFLTSSTLAKHVARLHSGTDKKFSCTFGNCEKTFFHGGELKRHTARHNGTEAMARCYFCPKLFASADALHNHMRSSHLREKALSCQQSLCRFRTHTAGKLKYHMKTRHLSPESAKPSKPIQICYFCSKPSRNLLLHLRGHTLETPFGCALCSKQFRTGQSRNEHIIQSHTLERPHSCQVCGRAFSKSYALTQHMAAHSSTKKYSCEFCPFETSWSSSLWTHKVQQHSEGCKERWESKICGKFFANKNSLLEHERRVHRAKEAGPRESFPCPECPSRFMNKNYVKVHFKKVHSGQEPKERCQVCPKTFKSEKALAEHAKIHINVEEREFACQDVNCAKRFNTSHSASQHYRLTHLNIRRFPCALCGKKFGNGAGRDLHISGKHLKEKPYPCGHQGCGASFSTIFQRRSHQRVHVSPGQRTKYSCDQCSKEYTCPESLRRHVNFVHLNLGHLCEVANCGKVFYQAFQLRRHVAEEHGGAKIERFGCDLCHKTFKLKTYVARHLAREHTPASLKPFVCQTCGKSFKLREGLTEHSRIHGSKNKVICETAGCGKSVVKKYLKKHIAIMHPSDGSE